MLNLTIHNLYKEVNMVDSVQDELQQLVARYKPLLKNEPFNELVEQLEYWLAQYGRGSLQALEFLTDNGRAMLNELKRRVKATLVALRDGSQYAVVSLDTRGYGCFTQAQLALSDEVDLDLEPLEEQEPDAYEVAVGAKTYNTFTVQ